MIPGMVDKAKRADFIREMISRDSGSVTDRAKQADFEQHMQNTGGFDPIGSVTDRAKQADFNQHMQNTGGFDPSSLMAAPQLRQDATRNQANMVSSPYEEANRKAAENTNPMNAESQNPGKSFLMQFLGRR